MLSWPCARCSLHRCPECPKEVAVKNDCENCGNRCMDMDMDPYCSAVNAPYGKSLCRGKPNECGAESLLWKSDERRRAAASGAR